MSNWKKKLSVAGARFSSSTFMICEQIGPWILLHGNHSSRSRKQKKTYDSFLFGRFIRFSMSLFPRNWKIYSLRSLCSSWSLLEQDFFRRVKRFTSAIDVTLDTTRSFSFAGNKISPGNQKGKDGKITEKMFMNFFIYDAKRLKRFAVLKRLI